MGNSSVMSSKGGSDSTFNDNLIREVRLNPIIYDFSHPLYGNAIKKQETWIEIAAKLNEKGYLGIIFFIRPKFAIF